MIKAVKNLFRSNVAKNASWIIGCRIVQMLISFFVGILTARYLGPGNYGLINYAGAYTAFFTSLCTLGINSIIIKDFVDHPDEQGETIGSAIGLRLISSALSALMIIGIVSIVDRGETTTILVTALCSLGLIFQTVDTINYWFQNRLQSKITSLAVLFGYIIVSAYKIILLILKKDVTWFAFSTSIDHICIVVFIYISYKKNGGPKLTFSFKKGMKLLKSSYHFIISGLMVAIYGYTDKFMLKQMLDESTVGYYSIATALCAVWTFVLSAIIQSMVPGIMESYSKDKNIFERKNVQLYAIVFYVSIFVSLFFTVFASPIISILYGAEYLPSIMPLRIVTWYTAFSYLGVARNAWIVCENKQRYLKYIYICAAVMNVAMNLIFIPFWGASGAAVASLLTQIFTSIILPLFMKDLRRNSILIFKGIALRGILSKNRSNP
ncbi:MAG TPA: flippase [Oscillospiraceae bacterium]|nr:flippase [Oscillospiraceae bacterium]HPF54938.1 flippase [Clostridiales bacterium]HPK34997.1 flippase [Oscillospiraceae bacterium]HPR75555.1 flippase [Oscillospiraceae bacterium]